MIDDLKKTIKPILINHRPCSGSMFAKVIRNYVMIMNKQTFPSITNALVNDTFLYSRYF